VETRRPFRRRQDCDGRGRAQLTSRLRAGGTGGAGGSGRWRWKRRSAGSSGGAVGNDASAGSGVAWVEYWPAAWLEATQALAVRRRGWKRWQWWCRGWKRCSGGVGGGRLAVAAAAGAPDAAPDVRIVDASAHVSVDNECSAATPLCLGNRCAKIAAATRTAWVGQALPVSPAVACAQRAQRTRTDRLSRNMRHGHQSVLDAPSAVTVRVLA